jgi:flagellar biogenesis protein FliO
LALAAVIGLILLMRWAGRKFLALPVAASTGLLQVVARAPLAPGSSSCSSASAAGSW